MKSNFQIIIIVIFIAAAIFSIFVFSGAIPIGSKSASTGKGTVVLWGTISNSAISPILQNFNNLNTSFSVKYVEKDSSTFDQDLLEALASGQGPDMFFLPDNLVFHYKNKIYPIPYASYSQASFKNTFAGVGEVFMTSGGILGFPIAIDPMVMYYNRAMLDTNSIASPPATWDDMISLVPLLTKKDTTTKQFTKSTIAFGQFSNVQNAKDIISALFMQLGNSIIKENVDGSYQSALSDNDLSSSLSFYSSFSDPLKSVYSWNKSLPSSTDAFASENLAFYFGYAGELPYIIKKNPNLNFAITTIPQIKGSKYNITSAHVMGIAVSLSSKNINTALTASTYLLQELLLQILQIFFL